ncbi:MAG TPA: beta-lactamase family protein [Clostridiaceae bacterium]|nr:beta-lactamase family protein [Clostridiaceae bacterium]
MINPLEVFNWKLTNQNLTKNIIRGKIIYENSAGFADRSNKVRNNMKTRFGIASGTKFFTALAIGKLIEQGKLSLETKVFDIIKYDFPLYSKEITIAQLLTHTSGIPDYYDEEKVDDYDNFFTDIPWYELREPKDYFPVFPQEKMKSIPGEKFSYCNSGFILLAAIVHEASGIPYARFVEENIFKEIGMNSSGFFELNRLPGNTALGYIKDENGWRSNIYNLPIIGGGDGGAFTTAEDLYILWDAFFNYKILSEDMTELYIKPYIEAESEGKNLYYGHGIWIRKKEDKSEEYIIGSDAGISFKSAVIRKNEVVYTVISNTSDGAWPLIRAIENHFFL